MYLEKRGDKLATELQTNVLGRIPLQQPDWNKEDFAPSVYEDTHTTALFIVK